MHKSGILFITLIILSMSTSNNAFAKNYKEGFEHFITVSGNQLMDGNTPFRFISFNVPTLHYNEDEFEFSRLHAYSLPDEYELRDVFETVKQTGGKVVRMYTIPVRMEWEPEGTPTYVEAPGVFSETAFQTLDLALALANEYQIRIIFSLLNNWQWMGGRPQYAGFRNKEKDEFWTDPQLKDDFKSTIRYTINRVNTLTGIPYRDDKAILCWETGNELTSPLDWTIEMTRYIKSLDSIHLVLDGYHAIDDHPVREGSVTEWSIDLVHSHHYEVNPADFITNVKRNIERIDGRKPYLIGEFGFVSTTAIEQYMNTIIESDIVGMLIWGLRGHRSKGGFYWHSEPLGYGRYKSYHWPGFDSGNEYDEKALLALLREKAWAIDGKTPPPLPLPKAPELLPIEHQGKISWRGAAGAAAYHLYRSSNANGSFELIGFNLSDADVQYHPLYNDESAIPGKSYYYRLIAFNASGESKPSNIVGPVKIESRMLTDNMNNFGKLYHCSKEITIDSDNDRQFKEDMHRLKGKPGDEIIYRIEGAIVAFTLFSFCSDDVNKLSFELSSDGIHYKKIEPERSSYGNGRGDYGYQVPIAWKWKEETKASYLKISFNNETQLSRMELEYR